MTDSVWPVVIAAWGAVVVAIVSATIPPLAEWIRNREKRRLDSIRKGLLKGMLGYKKFEWRDLRTLSDVIGADPSETKRLLLEIGARGSETKATHWGLISRHPLPTEQE